MASEARVAGLGVVLSGSCLTGGHSGKDHGSEPQLSRQALGGLAEGLHSGR